MWWTRRAASTPGASCSSACGRSKLITSSISSNGRPQKDYDVWKPKNANVHIARSDTRGYLRLSVKPERLHADLVAVDDIKRDDSPTHVLAAYDVEDGKPGIVR